MQTKIALKLSALCEHPQLWWEAGEVPVMNSNKSMNEIGTALVDILASEDLSPVTLFSLSREAWHYYLFNTRKKSHQETDEFPDDESDEFPERSFEIDEYLKLRKILLWCAVKSIRPADICSFDPVCLPGPELVSEYLDGSKKPHLIFSTVDASSLSTDREALVKAIDKKVLTPFLKMVELSSIHPELLFTVIKPLDIIEPELLRKAFVKQAVIGTRLLINYHAHILRFFTKKSEICKEQTYGANYGEQAVIRAKRRKQQFGAGDNDKVVRSVELYRISCQGLNPCYIDYLCSSDRTDQSSVSKRSYCTQHINQLSISEPIEHFFVLINSPFLSA